jgi:hypothetical protein
MVVAKCDRTVRSLTRDCATRWEEFNCALVCIRLGNVDVRWVLYAGAVAVNRCVRLRTLAIREASVPSAFADDQGNVWKVANPAICKGKMGKKG